MELKREEVIEFISNLRSDNSEFITNAMFSTLVKVGITISSENEDIFGKFVKGDLSRTTDKRTFESKLTKHDLYIDESENIAGLEYILSDSCKHQDMKLLFNNSKSVILDIDLDFFTYSFDNIFSRNPLDIKMQILSKPFRMLFKKSNIVTIALEPVFCGGIAQCINILQVFDRYFLSPKGMEGIINNVIRTFRGK